MADDIKATINNLYLFIPNPIPSIETQLMFNGATENIYKISFEEFYTERRLISDMFVQVDRESTQQVTSPKHLICAHQPQNRINVSKENDNIAVFDHLDLRKYHIEVDSQKYPRDRLLKNYEEKDYSEQYKDLNLFFTKYIGESNLKLFCHILT